MGGTYFDGRCIFSREGHLFLIALAGILWLKIFFWKGGGGRLGDICFDSLSKMYSFAGSIFDFVCPYRCSSL